MTLEEAQKTVDEWIKTYGVRYFSELTNMAVLTEEVGELLHTMRAFPCRWVLVSGETGLGGIRAERLARVFDDGLGLANQMLAAQAREAFLVVAGRCLRLEKLEF